MSNNKSQTNTIPHFLLNRAKQEIAHTKQEIVQAKERIPSEYHDFLIMLPQNVKINDNKYTVPQNAIELGVFSYDRGTYVSIEKPYMTVDGRIRMARDEHAANNKRLDIHPPVFVPFGDRVIVSVTVESEVHGSTTGTIEVGQGGGVDTSNPFANAQTSAIGRALGFMGYGLIGTGVLNSEELIDTSQGAPANNTPPATSTTPSATNGNAPSEYRLKVVGEVVFNRDRSSSIQVMLETHDTVALVIPAEHEHISQTLTIGSVIRVKGWLNVSNKRLRVSNDAPTIENNQAV